jgi:transposase
LVEQGLSLSKAAEETGLGKSTVQKISEKFKATGHVKDLERSGRPPKLDDRAMRSILRANAKDPFMKVREIREDFNSVRPPNRRVSNSTVQRILNQNGVRAYKLAEKWKISEKNRRLRVDWCRKHRSWTLEDWAGIIFSDESRIQNNPARRIIRVRKGAKIGAHLNPQRNRFDVAVMVWGYISFEGPRKLVFVNGTINGKKYSETLEDHLIAEVPGLRAGEFMFQHDNARPHIHKDVKAKLREYNIKTLDWPAQSPDLNLIEACWRLVKSKLKESYDSEAELRTDIQNAWDYIDDAFIRKLYISLPERLAEVIRVKGWPTRY